MDNVPVSCDAKRGKLPQCAPLSAGYVPYQQTDPTQYDRSEALTRGTLFPGLDLPFMNVINTDNPYAGTPLGELMTIDFAIRELNLYLDTHAKDTEAFEMLKCLISLSHEGRKRYSEMYGAIILTDLENSPEYNWLCAPWPWEYSEGTVND